MANSSKYSILVALLTTATFSCVNNNSIPAGDMERLPESAIEFNPQKYICYRGENIDIDGELNEDSWINAEWTSDFVDIEGDVKPAPLHKTHVKMLWDDAYLYIAAELYEPHIWAYLRQRDTVVYYDNDFEVFIDPDGDTHGYYEFEINANNTVWDLLLTRPYRDYGRVLDAWNINGMKTAVKIHGTLNNPEDTDEKWIIELAFPFDVLEEWGSKPTDGRQWRINLSRVNGISSSINGVYKQDINPETGRTYPEYNWVWSPQGIINMHAPETWGYMQFSDIIAGQGTTEFVKNPDEDIKWVLRQLYYAQRRYASEYSEFAGNIKTLSDYGFSYDARIDILIKPSGYEAYTASASGENTWVIDNTGRVYSIKGKKP